MGEQGGGKVIQHPRAAAGRSTRSAAGSDSGWTKSEKLKVAEALGTIAKEMAARGRFKTAKEVEALLPVLHRDLQSFRAADVLEALRQHRQRSPHFPTLYDIAKVIDELRRHALTGGAGAAGQVGGQVFVLERDPIFAICERLHLARHPHPYGITRVPRTDGIAPDGRQGRGWYFDDGIVRSARSAFEQEEESPNAMPF